MVFSCVIRTLPGGAPRGLRTCLQRVQATSTASSPRAEEKWAASSAASPDDVRALQPAHMQPEIVAPTDLEGERVVVAGAAAHQDGRSAARDEAAVGQARRVALRGALPLGRTGFGLDARQLRCIGC